MLYYITGLDAMCFRRRLSMEWALDRELLFSCWILMLLLIAIITAKLYVYVYYIILYVIYLSLSIYIYIYMCVYIICILWRQKTAMCSRRRLSMEWALDRETVAVSRTLLMAGALFRGKPLVSHYLSNTGVLRQLRIMQQIQLAVLDK